MSLCFMTYLGLDKVAKINMPEAFYFLATYYYNRNGISCFDPSLQENGNLFTEDTYLDDVERKLYKIKRILVKINLVTPDRISTFVNSFASYFMKNILYNTLAVKNKYNCHHDFSIKFIFLIFRDCLTSAPQCFKYLFFPVFSSSDNIYTTHARNILRDYYLDNKNPVYDINKTTTPFGYCDMFFLCLSLLLFSMIDSISIDLRWIIENETVRNYCTRITRKVCRFFKK